ncbi:RpiB/LacA/LacB family sugar-phosphate isomerase [Patescibacteria group bacterium]
MRIYLAADHAGFKLKEEIKKFLSDLGHDVKDFGAFEEDEKDDYPDFMIPLAEEISKDPENTKGILFGGSGQGEAIVANRFKGVRAVVYYGGEEEIVKLAREHNNANVLSLGARFVSIDEAENAVKIFLETTFDSGGENERHLRRINKIDN